MADWSLPGLTDLYTNILTYLKGRDTDAITLCVSAPTNTPTGAFKYVRASDKFQEWDGAAWQDKVLSIAGGGTGSATQSGARTALGLGTIATQDSNNVSITGGTIAGCSIAVSQLTGTIATARLGSGSATSGTWLRGDSTWQSIPAGVPTGFIAMYGGTAAPTDYLLCDGAAISRAVYAALFAVIGIAFGAGDLSTTFNLPDLRQRFPLGKAASGTGSTLGSTGGAIDHTHTSAAHTHTVAGHTHTITVGAHTHTISSDGGHTHTDSGTTSSVSVTHTHTFTSGVPSASGTSYSGGAGNTPPSDTHTHSGTTSTDSNTAHTHTYSSTTSSDGSHSHTGSTGSATPTGSASSTGLTTDSTTPGVTGANNPPYQVVNYIIHT